MASQFFLWIFFFASTDHYNRGVLDKSLEIFSYAGLKSEFTKHFPFHCWLSTQPHQRKSLFRFVSFICDFANLCQNEKRTPSVPVETFFVSCLNESNFTPKCGSHGFSNAAALVFRVLLTRFRALFFAMFPTRKKDRYVYWYPI